MKSREYGTWQPRNVFGPERQKLYDEHNRFLKRERAPQPKEYASAGIDEYYRVPEMKDMTGNPYEQNKDVLSGKSQKGTKNAGASRRQLMLRQVAGVLAGSVVVVTTYQAMVERRQQQPPPDPPAVVQPSENEPEPDVVPVILFPSWNWSEDNATAVVELSDGEGNVVKELAAEIEVAQDDATCSAEGLKTYTATTEDEGNTYTDSRTEVLPPLGHSFDEGKETVLEDGRTAVTFECTRCHEEFTVVTSMTEND